MKIDLRVQLMEEIVNKAQKLNCYVLDADCSRSTKTNLLKNKPNITFINVGIAEQNMIGIACGLSLNGEKVIVNAFCNMVCLRALDFIYQLCSRQNLDVTIIGHYAGLTSEYEGGSHHGLISLGLMYMCNFKIFIPYNIQSAKKCIDSVFEIDGPKYIHLAKFYDYIDDYRFIHQLYFDIYTKSENKDVLIITSGNCVNDALSASEILKQYYDIDVEVLIITTIDKDLCKYIKEFDTSIYNQVLILEDNYYLASIYNIIFRAINCPLINSLSINDFTESGNISELKKTYKIGVNNIIENILNAREAVY